MNNYLLRNGTIVDPVSEILEVSDLWIHNKLIRRQKPLDPNLKFETIELEGNYIFPGLIDLRCHLREANGTNCESILSGTKAAASGGYSSILTMPDISPQPDNAGAIRYIKDSADKNSLVKINIVGCLTLHSKGEALAPLGSLSESGIVAVSDCPLSTQNNEIFVKGVEYASMFNLPVIELPREISLSKNGSAHDGQIALSMGLGGYPRMAEELFVQRAITISRNLDAHIHLTSISSKGSVELIRDAKAKEIRVTADVTPHHLCFTDDSIIGYKTNFKTLPPLREDADKRSLMEGLMDGTLDCVSTAHEPYYEHLKNVEFDLAPAGVISLETTFASIMTTYKDKVSNLPLKMAKWLAYNPSKIINMETGTLNEGTPADIMIFDPLNEWTYETKKTLSSSKNSPFEKSSFRGVVRMTIVDGKIVYQRNN